MTGQVMKGDFRVIAIAFQPFDFREVFLYGLIELYGSFFRQLHQRLCLVNGIGNRFLNKHMA